MADRSAGVWRRAGRCALLVGVDLVVRERRMRAQREMLGAVHELGEEIPGLSSATRDPEANQCRDAAPVPHLARAPVRAQPRLEDAG